MLPSIMDQDVVWIKFSQADGEQLITRSNIEVEQESPLAHGSPMGAAADRDVVCRSRNRFSKLLPSALPYRT